jgi:outer membrane lipoprotein SlyB
MKRLIVAAAALATLAACTTTSPDVVYRHQAQQMNTVLDGVVLSTRPVVVEGSQSGIGSASGAVVGGIAGSNAGHYGSAEAAVGTILGAVIGGVVGNAAERYGTREEAIEILVQLRNGERRSIVQARAAEPIAAGDSVLLVSSGGRTRVTRAPVPTPSAHAAPRS